jgi:hypothetical protein
MVASVEVQMGRRAGIRAKRFNESSGSEILPLEQQKS